MELVQAVYVTSVNGPCFTAVQKDAKYNSTMDINFGFETVCDLFVQRFIR